MKHFAITTPTADQHRADTGGWDAVSCVKIGDINDAIRNAGTSPREFDISVGQSSEVKGTFVHWRVAGGGAGPLINLTIPIRDLEITRNDVTKTLEEVHATVQVRMELAPSHRKLLGAPPDTVEKLLVIDIGSNRDPNLLTSGPNDHAAKVMGISGDEDLGMRHASALRLGLETWLNENLDAFEHVFATVNVSTKLDEETKGAAFAWLKPTDVSYAFGHNTKSDEDSVLAILCQTQGRSTDGLVSEADSQMIPEGCNAGVCISRSRFLRNMIGEALPKAFKGLTAKDITYKDKDAGLEIKKPVKTTQVKHEGKTYDPIIHKMDVLLRDREMVIDSTTKTEVSPGIFSVCEATGYYGFGLMDRKDGGKTMGVVETRKMSMVESTEKTKAVTIIDIILGILAAIGGLVLTLVSFGTATTAYFVVLAIVLGSLAGTISIKVIEMVGEGNGPPVDLLLSNATSAVTWSTGATFDPKFAALNNGLQIGGHLVPSKPGLLSAGATLTAPDYHKSYQDQFKVFMTARRQS